MRPPLRGAGEGGAFLRVRSLLAVAAVVLLTACAAPQATALRGHSGGLPPAAEVAAVPFYAQTENYCGPAALAMALTWSGLPASQEEVAAGVFTSGRDGTLSHDMIAAARRHGRLAVPVGSLEHLLAELAAGNPVVVFQNLGLSWYPVWHYAVAVGYDLTGGSIYLRSGVERRAVMSLDTFEHTWARGGHWALVVLPPDRLPVAAPEDEVVRAVTGLERAGRLAEAGQAYALVVERWPRSLAGWIGLGNVRYAAGDAAGAEVAFREALERHPEAAAAWNNFAVALAKRGKRREALAAVTEAIRLRPDEPAYRQTLREIGASAGG